MLQNLNEEPERVRVPRTEWFALYRKTEKDEKVCHLIDAMYSEIHRFVTQHAWERFNSSRVGALILSSNWSHKEEWNRKYGINTTVSSSLFGQIMWTYFFDHEELWTWINTAHDQSDPQTREYFLRESG